MGPIPSALGLISRDFYLPEFQDIVWLKFWKSWTFANFRTMFIYIDVNFLCLWYTHEVKISCYKIRLAKTLHKDHGQWVPRTHKEVNNFESLYVTSHDQHSTLVQIMVCRHMAPEPMLINHQWGIVAFTWGLFHKKCSRKYVSLIRVWKLEITPTSARG